MEYFTEEIDAVDFSKHEQGLVPAVIQDAVTKTVLMLGYMNRESLQKTLDCGLVTFYSRSRQTLWTKGETSGNVLKVQDIRLDCDKDTILVKAIPAGPVCHTGADTCFFEQNDPSLQEGLHFLGYLQGVIQNRKKHPQEGSYTNHLFSKGVNKIAQKVGEEAVELIIEAKDNSRELFLAEAADLIYHLSVLFVQKGYSWEEMLAVLKERHSR